MNKKLYYGWIVLAACLIIGVIGIGIRYSFGVFFDSLETQFELNRAATSGLFSVYMLLSGLTSVLGGWAMDKYGPRKIATTMGILIGLSLLLSSQVQTVWQLFITYSVLLSLGTGAIFSLANSTVSRWFIKRRGFAVGISSSAGAVGQMVMAPIASLLVVHFAWRLSFIILGLLSMVIIVSSGGLLKKDPADMGLLPDGIQAKPGEVNSRQNDKRQDGLRLSEAYKTAEFWYLGLMWLLLSLSVNLILTHMIPHAMDLGISNMDAAFILSLIGFGGFAGRIGIGRLSDTVGRKVPIIICAMLQMGLLIWLIWIKELWMFYLFAVAFGCTWGGVGSQVTILIGDIFGVRSIGAIMGTISLGYDIGAAIGPALGGIIYDTAGNYSLAFAISAIGMLLTTVFAILMHTRPLQSKR